MTAIGIDGSGLQAVAPRLLHAPSPDEEALRRSEAFLAEAQRLSSTGSFSWRVASDEIIWSEQLLRIFEFDARLPVTLDRIASRVHPDDRSSFRDMLECSRADGGDIEYEHRLVMGDRSVKYLHMVARGTRDHDGRLEYIGAVQDVTRFRLAQEALRRARAELAHVARVMSLGALTASIAHQVNQPLSGIITNASTCLRMLNTASPDLEGAREAAGRMLRDGKRAAEVVTRLRTLFSKNDARNEPVDLNEVAREVIALSSDELRRNQVTVRTEFGEDLPSVGGDRVQLQQVILNLLLNALDAMANVDDRPRQVVISTEHAEDRVVLSVTDVGIGLAPQVADRLFEPFCTTKGDGMGIGLFVSRYIVERHHGCLRAAANDGPGATFSVSIPRLRQSATRRVRATSCNAS